MLLKENRFRKVHL